MKPPKEQVELMIDNLRKTIAIYDFEEGVDIGNEFQSEDFYLAYHIHRKSAEEKLRPVNNSEELI